MAAKTLGLFAHITFMIAMLASCFVQGCKPTDDEPSRERPARTTERAEQRPGRAAPVTSDLDGDGANAARFAPLPTDLVAQLPIPHDQRPVFLLNCFGGFRDRPTVDPDDNDLGLRPQWRGLQGVRWYEEQIQRAANAGFRRVLVNRPHGQLDPGISAHAWEMIRPEKRELIAQANRRLKARYPGLQIMAYIGCNAYEQDPRVGPSEERTKKNGRPVFIGDGSPLGERLYRDTILAMRDAGFDGFGLDASSVLWAHYGLDDNGHKLIALAERAARDGIFIMGEAVPVVVTADRAVAIDRERVVRAPYIALMRYYNARFGGKFPAIRGGGLYVWLAGEGWADLSDQRKRERLNDALRAGVTPVVTEADLWVAKVPLPAPQ